LYRLDDGGIVVFQFVNASCNRPHPHYFNLMARAFSHSSS
jgi:hypothetical protein